MVMNLDRYMFRFNNISMNVKNTKINYMVEQRKYDKSGSLDVVSMLCATASLSGHSKPHVGVGSVRPVVDRSLRNRYTFLAFSLSLALCVSVARPRITHLSFSPRTALQFSGCIRRPTLLSSAGTCSRFCKHGKQ